MTRVLAVDDASADLELVRRSLEKQGHDVDTASTVAAAIEAIRRRRPDVAVLDVILPDGNGLELVNSIRAIDENLPIIFVTSSGESDTAIEAMKRGALDYLVKPIDVSELRRTVARAMEIRRLTEKPVEFNAVTPSRRTQSIIGRCPAMQEVYKAIGIVANQDVTVLIRGESGTGKELVARALYQHSDRSGSAESRRTAADTDPPPSHTQSSSTSSTWSAPTHASVPSAMPPTESSSDGSRGGPFLAVNCAAIPETLLESELFGHERGAFTGADRKRIGKFEQAAGGTLFLDEIGDMSPMLQSKLLRVLQERQFERVGGNEVITTDVRVIAATHRNLEKMFAEGDFRADLYYRLNGFTIHLPPLRDRGEDLRALVDHFCHHAASELNKPVVSVASETLNELRRHTWPGNIRELQNVIRQAVLKASGGVLLPDFLPDLSTARSSTMGGQIPAIAGIRSPGESYGSGLSHSGLSRGDGRFAGDGKGAGGGFPAGGGDASSGLLHAAAVHGLIDNQIGAEQPQIYRVARGEFEADLVEALLRRTAGNRVAARRLMGVDPAELASEAARAMLTDQVGETEIPGGSPDADETVDAPPTLEQMEQVAIAQALARHAGCRKAAAEELGISVRTMQRRVKQFGL